MADEAKKADELKAEEKQEEIKVEEEEVKEPEEKEEELPESPYEMDPDQLDKTIEKMTDEETGEIKEPEIKTEEEKEAEAEAKAEAATAEEEKKKEEESTPEKKYDAQGHEITGDPLRDTQAALQRERDKRVEMERKLEEERFKGFEKLGTDDEDLLKEEDPDGYLVYKERERDYEKHTADLLDDDINEAHKVNRDSVIDFMAGQLELDSAKPGDQERIISLLRNPDSEESQMMMKLDNFLSDNMKPVKTVKVSDKDAIPVYSAEQLATAHKIIYHDKIIADREKVVREATLTKIETAEKGGSHFDRLGKTDDSRPAGGKKIDEYTQDEIYNMTEDQLETLSKQVDTG